MNVFARQQQRRTHSPCWLTFVIVKLQRSICDFSPIILWKGEELVIHWTPNKSFSASGYLMNFADTTSCHGLNRCAAHKGPKRKSLRCAWILLSVLAFICFNVHLGYLVKYYMAKPTTTSVYVTGIPFRYPTVTVCNRKLLSVSYTKNYDYGLYRWHNHSKTSWDRLQMYSEDLRETLMYITKACYCFFSAEGLSIRCDMFTSSIFIEMFISLIYTFERILSVHSK